MNALSSLLLLSMTERVGWAIVHSFWLGAITAVALAFALRVVRNAAARHLACMLALVVTLASTVVVFAKVSSTTKANAPSGSREFPPPAHSSVRSTSTGTLMPPEPPDLGKPKVARSAQLLPQASINSASNSNASQMHVAGAPLSPLQWEQFIAPALPSLSVGWLIGVILLSLRHFAGWCRVRTWRRTGKRLPDAASQGLASEISRKLGLRRLVPIMESVEVFTPMLVGTIRPIVLLPLRVVTGFTTSELEAILAHELAHLARRDAWANLLQLVCETMLFYHPAVWWMSRKARVERENAADDLATAVCADRLQYANALARLAEQAAGPRLALAANDGALLARIRRLLLPAPRASTATGGWVAGVLMLIGLLGTTLLLIVETPTAGADNAPRIKVVAGESIQTAIDAAPAGAVIQLSAGEWKERITISKPLTLEGAGWEKTLIKPDQLPPGVTPKTKAEFRDRYVPSLSVSTRAALDREWADKFARPTVLVQDTANVMIRGLRIGGVAPPIDQPGGGEALVVFRKAQASMSDCAVVGPAEDGIQIDRGSDIKIYRSLVAALRGQGIVTEGLSSAGPPSRLHLVESDIRTVGTGVRIGQKCDGTLIERTRISGSRGSGIEYEETSPVISGNAVFSNGGSGIHAHGKTHAMVRGNLLWKNKTHAISCWFDNADTIEGNTFVENVHEALLVMGNSKPMVIRNIFAGSAVAINCGMVGPQIGQPVLTSNLFWETPSVLQTMEEKKPAPAGSLSANPQFLDPSKAEFALAPSSPARAANIGLLESLSSVSPWPILAEETAIVTSTKSTTDADEARGFPAVTEEMKRKAAEEGKKWIEDAFQLDDKAKRETAIERIRAAMGSGNVDEARAGVTAFVRLGPIEFDKASFLPVVRALLGSADVPTRAAAASAVTMTGAEPADIDRILTLANDPAREVRQNLSWIIAQLHKGDLTARGGDAVLKLLASTDRNELREVLRGIWGAKFSPALESRVVELSQNLESASTLSYDAMYFALSTQANKSEASVKRLIELLSHQDTTNIAGRCAWGLEQGVGRSEFPLVADAMVKVLEARSDGYLRNNALRCLRAYGDVRNAPALKALLTKPGVTGEFRKLLDETLASLEKRAAETGQQSATVPEPATSTVKPAVSKTIGAAAVSPAASAATDTPEIEVEWRGKWWPAKVIKKVGDTTLIHYIGYGIEWDESVPAERIRPLQPKSTPGKTAAVENAQENAETTRIAQLVEQNRRAARLRAAEDRRYYSPEQLQEIETLYQVANTKGKRNEEAKASLKQLLEKYDKANRTGCATLYLGQASEGAERIEYLTRAVEKFSDCYYFNGCQVGGYGRYVLALTLWDKGEKDKARALIEELKTVYKDATDHRGQSMSKVAEALEKEFAKQQ